MALDVYFKDDIAQGITAVTVAMLTASIANGAPNIEYTRAIVDTARAHALNYGIDWAELVSTMCLAIEDTDTPDLLELATRLLPGG